MLDVKTAMIKLSKIKKQKEKKKKNTHGYFYNNVILHDAHNTDLSVLEACVSCITLNQHWKGVCDIT